jgi:Methyltransferase domain
MRNSARELNNMLTDSAAPPPRIFTAFGTVLYVDVSSGELRHGPVENSPANVIFVLEGQRGQITYDTGGSRQPIACQADHSRVAGSSEPTARTILEIIHLNAGWLGFHLENVFLCAEPDGRVTLCRPHCRAWENFILSDPPRSTDVFQALGLLKPYDIPSFVKKRMGWKGDGGYVLLDDFDSVNIVYSVGIGSRVSFDLDLANKGKDIFMFDHTIDGPPLKHPKFHFFKQGIAAANDEAALLFSLAHQIQKLGHEGRSDMILKLDIEGAELAVFSAMPRDVFRQFRQITMEVHALHRMNDAAYRAAFLAAFSNINSVFTLFHAHANNYSPLGLVDGHTVADVLELSYVRSDLVKRVPSKTVYPTVFDFPNWPSRPDHILWFYPFLPTIEDSGEVFQRSMSISNRLYPHGGLAGDSESDHSPATGLHGTPQSNLPGRNREP